MCVCMVVILLDTKLTRNFDWFEIFDQIRPSSVLRCYAEKAHTYRSLHCDFLCFLNFLCCLFITDSFLPGVPVLYYLACLSESHRVSILKHLINTIISITLLDKLITFVTGISGCIACCSAPSLSTNDGDH